MALSSGKKRPSFLRPLTQIAPQNENAGRPLSTTAELGPTSRGTLAHASFGHSQRTKSFSSQDAGDATARATGPPLRHAAPSSSIGTRSASQSQVGVSPSSASSRRQSFASTAARRQSMSAREPTKSRRSSSAYAGTSFGGDEPGFGPEGVDLSEEDKALEAEKAFANAIKVLWESGVEKTATDLGESVVNGWKSGDIVGLFSIDNLGLSRVENANAIVLADTLTTDLAKLAATALAHEGTWKALRSLDDTNVESALDALSEQPVVVALFLKSLESLSKLLLRTLPAFGANLALPESLNPAFYAFLNLVTFLAGSSTDLRRALASAINLTNDAAELVENAARAVVAITARAPPAPLRSTLVIHPIGKFLFSPDYAIEQWNEIKGHINTLLAQPAFENLLAVFKKDVKATGDGLVGNARVARAVRGVERIYRSNHPTWALREKVGAVLDAFSVIGWELASVESDTEEFSYKFDNLKPQLGELLPRDVAFSFMPGTAAPGSEGAPSTVTLRDCKLVLPHAKYAINKKGGVLAFEDKGFASIEIPFDIVIDFGTVSGQPAVSAKAGKPSVELKSTAEGGVLPASLGKVWSTWLSSVVRSKLSESIEDRFDAAIGEWIAPLFAPSHVPIPAKNQPLSLSALGAGDGAPTARSISAGSIKAPGSATGNAPVGVRQAFLQSLRMSSGVGERIRPLATGRDVLESLSNPFSGPNTQEDGQDEDALSDASGLPASAPPRRMSMAHSLTDVVKQDMTEFGNIENPPRAPSVSAGTLDDEAERRSLSFASRRLSLAYAPAGEHSLDAYDQEFGADAIDEYEAATERERQGTGAGPKHRAMSMADYLNDVSAADTTTPESLAASAKKARHGFEDQSEFIGARQNLSMARVTQHLQGQDAEAVAQADVPPALHRAATTGGINRTEAPHPQAYQKPIRRKSMSEHLSELAMADHTDPTVFGKTRANPEPDVYEPGPTMSSALDQIASTDATLRRNIATPPRSRNSSFIPGAASIEGGAVGARNDNRPRTKSFMALSEVPTMSELGADDKIVKDDLEEQFAGHGVSGRRKSNAEEYAGIDPAELKKRRMSSFMSGTSDIDGTLVENIRKPSSVDQAYDSVAAQPHSLAARRQSVVGA